MKKALLSLVVASGMLIAQEVTPKSFSIGVDFYEYNAKSTSVDKILSGSSDTKPIRSFSANLLLDKEFTFDKYEVIPYATETCAVNNTTKKYECETVANEEKAGIFFSATSHNEGNNKVGFKYEITNANHIGNKTFDLGSDKHYDIPIITKDSIKGYVNGLTVNKPHLIPVGLSPSGLNRAVVLTLKELK